MATQWRNKPLLMHKDSLAFLAVSQLIDIWFDMIRKTCWVIYHQHQHSL